MATDLIRYDVLVQQALRSVVRKVLTDGARDGLPGAHHFYISFRTHAPSVKISPRLKDMYPDEMTIVMQHQFWDLSVNETGFEISLSFDKIAERLVIPFEAITGFFDPSVKFGLKFEAADVVPENDDTAEKPAAKPRKLPTRKSQQDTPDIAQIGKKPVKAPAQEPAAAEAAAPPVEEKAADASAQVVSLDSFRKKK